MPSPLRHVACLLTLVALGAPLARAQPAGDGSGPEPVVRALMRAMLAADRPAFERLTVPDPRRGLLTRGGSPNAEALRALDEDPAILQVQESRPFEVRGREAPPDSAGGYPVGTTALYLAAYQGQPVIVRLVRRTEGWRVDLRWWLTATEMATSGKGDAPGTPAAAARSLVSALLRLDRAAAARLVVPDSVHGVSASVGVLFEGAPRQREPSGHLDALALEMPLVEIGPGEFAALSAGRAVEGTSGGDVRVLVGQFGSVEIPFVVRRTPSGWRVAPEPYFGLLNR